DVVGRVGQSGDRVVAADLLHAQDVDAVFLLAKDEGEELAGVGIGAGAGGGVSGGLGHGLLGSRSACFWIGPEAGFFREPLNNPRLVVMWPRCWASSTRCPSSAARHPPRSGRRSPRRW